MVPRIGKSSRGVLCEKLHSGIAWLREEYAQVGTLEALQKAIRYSLEGSSSHLHEGWILPASLNRRGLETLLHPC